jgi:Ca2+-binding EF-hand superfamily protein
MIEQVDANRNGAVEFDEFVVMMKQQDMNHVDDADLVEAFKFFDKVRGSPPPCDS